jgi:hypothetical protein
MYWSNLWISMYEYCIIVELLIELVGPDCGPCVHLYASTEDPKQAFFYRRIVPWTTDDTTFHLGGSARVLKNILAPWREGKAYTKDLGWPLHSKCATLWTLTTPWLHLAPTPPSGWNHPRVPSWEEHWLLAEEATTGGGYPSRAVSRTTPTHTSLLFCVDAAWRHLGGFHGVMETQDIGTTDVVGQIM